MHTKWSQSLNTSKLNLYILPACILSWCSQSYILAHTPTECLSLDLTLFLVAWVIPALTANPCTMSPCLTFYYYCNLSSSNLLTQLCPLIHPSCWLVYWQPAPLCSTPVPCHTPLSLFSSTPSWVSKTLARCALRPQQHSWEANWNCTYVPYCPSIPHSNLPDASRAICITFCHVVDPTGVLNPIGPYP